MKRRLEGIVEGIISDRPGAQELWVRTGDPTGDPESSEQRGDLRRAVNLRALTGAAAVGDRVLLNIIANELALGTGGVDFVVAIHGAAEEESDPPGHIVKLRYTPLQIPVLAVESQESQHHDRMNEFTSLDGMPVVCAELHSQLPGVCASAYWAMTQAVEDRAPRIVYVMTDGASLPIAFSRLVPLLKEKNLISTTVTAGQAFGGDLEAVNLYSALAAAKEVAGADIIVVAQGPGSVGTGTTFGFSGVDQGLAINAAASLGGAPVAVARISFAERRERHQGISHHTVTVLKRIAMAGALLPVPMLEADQQAILATTLAETGLADLHEPVWIDAERGLAALEAHGIGVTTMGRDLNQERPFFLSAAAAGLLAAQIAEARETSRCLPNQPLA